MKRLVGGCVVLSAVLSALLGVGPAAADDTRLVARDGSRDVLREPRACPGTGCAPTEQGRTKPGADIARLRAAYASDLTISLKVRGEARRVFYVWRVHTAGADVFPAVVKRRGNVTVRFFDGTGEAAACDGLTGSPDPTTRVASVVVPAVCFGSPDQVRSGVQVIVYSRAYLFVDDAQRDHFRWRGVDRAKLSPALPRVIGAH